jgi:hypothetical protein
MGSAGPFKLEYLGRRAPWYFFGHAMGMNIGYMTPGIYPFYKPEITLKSVGYTLDNGFIGMICSSIDHKLRRIIHSL